MVPVFWYTFFTLISGTPDIGIKVGRFHWRQDNDPKLSYYAL